MSDNLSKKESIYFFTIALVVLTVMFTGLFFWSETQENCWDKYQTERQAIINCEGG
jgi:hypothetical protein